VSRPLPPSQLWWAPEIPIQSAAGLRYVEAGRGRPLLLLHTMRTQLDYFHKVFPRYATRFRVLAPDLPGHGWSNIEPGDYSPEFFCSRLSALLTTLQLEDVVIAGESIGAVLALLLATRQPERVAGVVAVNPYDYGDARSGIRRSSLLANFYFGAFEVPWLGPLVARAQARPAFLKIFEGGVRHRGAWSPRLVDAMLEVGRREGQAAAMLALFRGWRGWMAARAEYAHLKVPALLAHGDHDWSRPSEREEDAAAIPGASRVQLAETGHFASVDSPEGVAEVVEAFALNREPAR